jgi:tetratricopeptide (TPR) repeat protein
MTAKLFIAIVINAILTSVAAGQAPTGANSSSPSALNETVAAAMGALRQKDFAAAIPPLEKLVAAAPDVAEYQADLGIAYYSVGRPRDAIAPCRKALKLKPSLAAARYFLDTSLAEAGECDAALPLLEKDYASNQDPQLRRVMGMDGARCGMARGDPVRAVKFFQWLQRDFPDDLDVLYLGTRIYSQLSTLTSQQLLRLAPNSYQAHRLSAEAFETEGQTADAIEEYRKILAADPHLFGIHYRIGRLLLARDRQAATREEARHEFEMELQITPENADAEYELAEMAREARQWDEAIRLFGRAVKFDPKFPDAQVGLGKSLVSAGRAAEAVAPLERAVKLAPNNAVAHYQLSFAYLRTGRDAEAQRELALYRQAHEQEQNIRLTIRQGLSDSMARPQTAEPPE